MEHIMPNITVKKTYQDLVEFLQENKNKKVSTILPTVLEMTKQKNNLKTHLVHNGKVFAIFCYYHKQWELLEHVEYGQKASSATGYNTMCKIGVSKWTKQNNKIKKIGSSILAMLETGKLQQANISDKKAELVAKAKELDVTDMPEGFETLEEVQEILKK